MSTITCPGALGLTIFVTTIFSVIIFTNGPSAGFASGAPSSSTRTALTRTLSVTSVRTVSEEPSRRESAPVAGAEGMVCATVGASVSRATCSVTSARVCCPLVSTASTPTVGGWPAEMIGAESVRFSVVPTAMGVWPGASDDWTIPPLTPATAVTPSSSPTRYCTGRSSPSRMGSFEAGERIETLGG